MLLARGRQKRSLSPASDEEHAADEYDAQSQMSRSVSPPRAKPPQKRIKATVPTTRKTLEPTRDKDVSMEDADNPPSDGADEGPSSAALARPYGTRASNATKRPGLEAGLAKRTMAEIQEVAAVRKNTKDMIAKKKKDTAHSLELKEKEGIQRAKLAMAKKLAEEQEHEEQAAGDGTVADELSDSEVRTRCSKSC